MKDDRALPYYRWYVVDHRASRTYRELSWKARGVYRELLDECWLEGGIPADPKRLAQMFGVPLGEMSEIWEELESHFVPASGAPEYFVTHPRLEAERTEQDRIRLAKKRGGETRAAQMHPKNPGHLQESSRTATGELEESLASSSSSSSRAGAEHTQSIVATSVAPSRVALVPQGKSPPKAKPAKPPNWVDRFVTIWVEAGNGVIPHQKLGGQLKQAVQAFGEERVEVAWRRFAHAKERRFGASYFAEHMGDFEPRLMGVGGELTPAELAELGV